MLSIVDKPTFQYIIEDSRESCIEKILIVAWRRKNPNLEEKKPEIEV